MRKLHFIASLLFVASLISACGGQSSSESTLNELESSNVAAIEVSIDSLITDASALVDQTVKFTALVDHACKHSGKKLSLVGSIQGKKFKVISSPEVPQFDHALSGSQVEIIGIVRAAAAKDADSCETHGGEGQPKRAVSYTVECLSVKEIK